MDWELLRSSLWPIVRGALTGTIPLTLSSFALGLTLGLIMALMRLSRLRVVSAIARVYISVIRGTPLLVQLFVISLVKDTSLASLILVTELFPEAQQIAAFSQEFMVIYVEAAAVYWVICLFLSVGQSLLETRLDRYVAH